MRMAQLHKESSVSPLSWMSWWTDPVLIVTISVVFSLDQITKAVVRHSLLLRESIPSGGPFHITHTFNTGSAFGLFPDQTFFLIVASFVGIGILLVVYRNHSLSSFPLRLSIGMQLGGAMGNLVDRVRMGHVTDFIELGFWPIFNLADASIVIGIIILLSLFLLTGKKEGRPLAEAYANYDEAEDGSVVPAPVGGVESLDGALLESHEGILVQRCPICDSAMVEVLDVWRCVNCGVKKWAEERGLE